MLFRFLAGIILALAIGITGTWLESQNLAMRRRLSQQHYRAEVLREQWAQERARFQKLASPARLASAVPAAGKGGEFRRRTPGDVGNPLRHWDDMTPPTPTDETPQP